MGQHEFNRVVRLDHGRDIDKSTRLHPHKHGEVRKEQLNQHIPGWVIQLSYGKDTDILFVRQRDEIAIDVDGNDATMMGDYGFL